MGAPAASTATSARGDDGTLIHFSPAAICWAPGFELETNAGCCAASFVRKPGASLSCHSLYVVSHGMISDGSVSRMCPSKRGSSRSSHDVGGVPTRFLLYAIPTDWMLITAYVCSRKNLPGITAMLGTSAGVRVTNQPFAVPSSKNAGSVELMTSASTVLLSRSAA